MRLNQLFSHWDQVHKDTLAVMDRFSEGDLGFVPVKGGWCVGQIMVHIAEAEEGWFGTIAQNNHDSWPKGINFENYPTKADIKALLVDTHHRTMKYLETLSMDDLEVVVSSEWGNFSIRFIIWHVLEHEIHHRGELSLILGILGRDGLDV